MKRTRIYICGKITGDKDYWIKFNSAELRLRIDGGLSGDFGVINPVLLGLAGSPWNQAMKVTISSMLLCDGVALLPDWKESKGAKIEARLAKEVGIPVKPIDEWLEILKRMKEEKNDCENKIEDFLRGYSIRAHEKARSED